MAVLRAPGATTDGPNANSEFLDLAGILPIQGSQTLPNSAFPQVIPGQVAMRDLTRQVSNLIPVNNAPSVLLQPNGDFLCLPTSTNSGDVFGVYQTGGGPGFTNSTGSQFNYNAEKFRRLGVGQVLAGALAAGTTVKVGDGLIVNIATPFFNYALSGARAIGTAVARVVGYPIQANIPLAITATGSQAVLTAAPPSYPWFGQYANAGITTTTPLIIDVGANQETVTPTAVAAGTAATTTLTVAGAAGINTLTVTLSGVGFPTVVVNTAVTAANTATTAAAAVVANINSLNTYVTANNAAGVITIAYTTVGVLGNTVLATASVTGAGGFTFAGTAALSGGVACGFTAIFANAHGVNCPIQGFVGTVGAVIIPTGAGGNLSALVLANIEPIG